MKRIHDKTTLHIRIVSKMLNELEKQLLKRDNILIGYNTAAEQKHILNTLKRHNEIAAGVVQSDITVKDDVEDIWGVGITSEFKRGSLKGCTKGFILDDYDVDNTTEFLTVNNIKHTHVNTSMSKRLTIRDNAWYYTKFITVNVDLTISKLSGEQFTVKSHYGMHLKWLILDICEHLRINFIYTISLVNDKNDVFNMCSVNTHFNNTGKTLKVVDLKTTTLTVIVEDIHQFLLSQINAYLMSSY